LPILPERNRRLTSGVWLVALFIAQETHELHHVHDGIIEAGDYAFPFEFKLDDNLQPSFKLRDGHPVMAKIVYAFKACLDVNGFWSEVSKGGVRSNRTLQRARSSVCHPSKTHMPPCTQPRA
jgi:hypothetical protein